MLTSNADVAAGPATGTSTGVDRVVGDHPGATWAAEIAGIPLGWDAPDATLWFKSGTHFDPGTMPTLGRPMLVVVIREDGTPAPMLGGLKAVAGWLRRCGVRTLEIAGDGEDAAPGIGEWAGRYVADVLALLD